jgi:hypothetical protein
MDRRPGEPTSALSEGIRRTGGPGIVREPTVMLTRERLHTDYQPGQILVTGLSRAGAVHATCEVDGEHIVSVRRR